MQTVVEKLIAMKAGLDKGFKKYKKINVEKIDPIILPHTKNQLVVCAFFLRK